MSEERLNDDVETVKGFCFLGNALNARGGFEMTIVARTRIGWMRIQKCGEILYGRRFCYKRESVSDLSKIGSTI